MPDDLEDAIVDLANAFPQQAVSGETLDVYARELRDLDRGEVRRAVSVLIRSARYFPRVAEIREQVAERSLALPSEATALEQISARSAWAREPEEERGDPPAIHPLVRRALDLVGGAHAFKVADDPGVVRGQFLRLYRDERARAVAEAQAGR